MILEQHYLGCLSQASYLLGDEVTGSAAVVDPRRDVDEYLQAAARHGLTIRHVLLTHFHADFVSGHLELMNKTGATIHLGAGANAEYPFTPMADGDELALGKVRVRTLATPGHTPESVCYLVFDDGRDTGRPYAVLTGDTLFIGDVGRPDLMASRGLTAEELAGHLYDSLRDKILPLPDDTILYPGHGAGSACGKSLGSETSSTIGRQRQVNYALQPMLRQDFIRLITAGLPPAPAYFQHDARFNRSLHTVLEETVKGALRSLSLEELLERQRAGARVLDVRPAAAFAAGHLVGSVNVGLDGRFASWVGSVLDSRTRILIVAERGREKETVVRLGRIGFDGVEGYLEGGIDALQGRADLVGTFRRYRPGELAVELESEEAPVVIDVREPGERSSGHLAGSLHVPLSRLMERLDEIPRDREVVVHCAGGYRSCIAASLLRQDGRRNICDLEGGFSAWAEAGHPRVAPAPEPARS